MCCPPLGLGWPECRWSRRGPQWGARASCGRACFPARVRAHHRPPGLGAPGPHLLAEGLLEAARLLGRQVAAEEPGAEIARSGSEPARSRAAAEDEERRRAGHDLVADALDEVV